MSAVYTHQVPEKFNYRRLSSSESINDDRFSTMSYRKYPEMFYIKSNNNPESQTPTSHDSNSAEKMDENLNYHPSFTQKVEMYYLTAEDAETQSNHIQHEQPKLASIIKNSHDPPQSKVTTYMITAANEDNYSEDISHTPSPRKRRNKKKHVVTFDTFDNNEKYDILPTHHYTPLLRSRASESIQRSMSKYRFNGN